MQRSLHRGQKYFNLSELVEVSYTRDLLPVVAAEIEYAEIYSTIYNTVVKYYGDHKTAKEQHLLQMQREEDELEHIAYQVFQKRRQLSESFPQHILHKASPSVRLQHQQEIQELIETSRKAYSRLREMQDYGIKNQKSRRKIYTVNHINFERVSMSYEKSVQKVFYDDTRLQDFLSRHLFSLRVMEQEYQNTFGYTDLEEAIQHERYLQVLLETYTIQELYTMHYTYFPEMSAKRMCYKQNSTRTHDLLTDYSSMFQYMYQYVEDNPEVSFLILQRNIMRMLYDRPEVLENAADLPFQWIAASLDTSPIHHYHTFQEVI